MPNISWVYKKYFYKSIAQSIEKTAIITTKKSWFWSFLWWCMCVPTLGLISLRMPKSRFLKKYSTTIGPIQAYPQEYSHINEMLIVHECQHTKQAIFCGYFVPFLGWLEGFFGRKIRAWVGLPIMLLVYGVLPFPIYFCYGRYRLELNADRRACEWALKNGYSMDYLEKYLEYRANCVGGGEYLWSWPKFAVKKGYKKLVDDLKTKSRWHL
jgi:hypothetical protein